MAKVRRGVFLRRIMGLLVAAIVLSAALTMLFYYTVTSDVVYVNLTQREFSKKASFLADESANYLSGCSSEAEYQAMLELIPEMLDATVVVRLHILEEAIILQPQGSDLDRTAIDALLESLAGSGAEGELDEVIQDRLTIGDPARDVVVVAYPIRVLDEGTAQRSVRGTVNLVKSMETIRTGYASINFALIFASGIAVLLMLVPTYIAVSRLTRPLKQVKDVATAMSHGNFTLRADTEQPGEIGELAAAINDLASDLDRSISALLHERNRLQQILDGLSEGIIAVENDLSITHTNSAVAELLSPVQAGYSPDGENPAMASLHELNPEDDPYGIATAFSETIGTETAADLDIELEDRIIRVQITPLYDDRRRVIGAVGLLRDVTSTEALEKTRRDYVANVSHELRTPLTAMRGLIEPLTDGLVTDEQDRRRYYSIILDETLRLSRLIDDMLELSRLQAGAVSLRQERFSLWEIFDTLQSTYAEMTAYQDITFAVMDWDPDCPDGWSNPDRIEQVMVILIDNAIKFTPAGGIIELGATWDSERIVVHVKDTGSGIEAADVPHVFERFYKADKSRGQRGTGLGLSIAREMMDSLGERIWVRSHVGQGSTFYFTITAYSSQVGKGQ